MTNKYSESFKKALENYNNKTRRPGYPPDGPLDHLNFFNGKYSRRVGLEKDLNKCDSDEAAEELIEDYLKKQKNVKNQSFYYYLLDELMQDFPKKHWHNPKPIKFYNENQYLYLGSLQKHTDVFIHGFKNTNLSYALDDYISGRAGIVTSKSLLVASEVINERPPTTTDKIFYIYVYLIKYRGCEAIDPVATLALRGNHKQAAKADNGLQVKIVGDILTEDIQGAYVYACTERCRKLNGYEKNDNYKEFRPFETEPRSGLIVANRDFPLTMRPDAQDIKEIKRLVCR